MNDEYFSIHPLSFIPHHYFIIDFQFLFLFLKTGLMVEL